MLEGWGAAAATLGRKAGSRVVLVDQPDRQVRLFQSSIAPTLALVPWATARPSGVQTTL